MLISDPKTPADPRPGAPPVHPVVRGPWPARLLLILLAGLSAYVGARLGIGRPAAPPPPPPNPVQAATRQIPGVFTIYTYDQDNQELGQGSGFLVSPDGLGVTNLHVLEDAHHATAKLSDGRVLEVTAIHAHDEPQDMLVLQLSEKTKQGLRKPANLHFLTVVPSTGIQVGDRVVTVTAPQGLSNTVTDGLVSSIRDEGKRRLLQITAPISHGSSGGPVFDTEGRVIAVATSQMDEGQNLNFAVPSEAVLPLLKRRDGLSVDKFRQRTQASAASEAGTESCFRLGQQLYDDGRYREALEEFFHAQEEHPAAPDPYFEAANCYLRLGAIDAAARQYYRFLMFVEEGDKDRDTVIDWLRAHGKRLPPL